MDSGNHQLEHKELVVDRVEGNIVVCEDLKTGNTIKLDKELIKIEIKDGDFLKYNLSGNIYVDKEQTQKRREYIDDMFNNLFD